ncbi:Alpha/Beta hydrolase protein [Absidia repens]|uniref:Alpha/Beta hydrolase protein n=1 Tax=Absidia repens TaxID=90262 RepID=A0A1X2HYP8_9FUNG|nr:Alpha/Beta hydrolase protein [Absidia repens]
MDPTFDFFDHTIPHTRYLENNDLFQQRAQQAADKAKQQTGEVPDPIKTMVHRPDYSLSLAYTLSVASKLGYEDLNVIKHELYRAGFNVKDTFRPFAYKNICAYVVEKDDIIFLVFRGSNPLNIQNYLTNIDIRMRDVYAPWGYMGRVHKGYFDALGDPPLPTSSYQKEEQTASAANSPSLWQWLFQKGMDHVIGHWMHQLMDPVDYRFVDPKNSQHQHPEGIRDTSMYIQAESYILELMERQQHKKLYITGHSLGAALGTMFLAKMVQSDSLLLQHLGGLYTFGQPKLGDHQFSKIFDAKLSSKIFHHTYNNDVFTRLPSYSEYAAPPGTLVFIDSAYEITIYPPGPKTGTPVPVRPISHLHLSGLLNRHVLHRLANENWIRILFRVLAPYMINDHFAADYPKCLQHGHITWVIMEDDANQRHPPPSPHRFLLPNNIMTPMGGDTQKTQRPSLMKRRSSRINVAEIES